MMSSTCTRSVSPIRSGASAAQVAGCIFSALPITRSTSGMAAKVAGSVCAAQPVTMIRAVRVVAPQPPDLLPRLAHRLGGHGAGVDDTASPARASAASPSSPRSRRR
jgi:hypothetical protein